MVEPTPDVLPATAWEVKVTPEPEPPTLRKRLGSPPLEREVLPGSSCQNRGISPAVVQAFGWFSCHGLAAPGLVAMFT